MAKPHSTETQGENIDLLDLVDELHKEFSSLKAINLLLHNHLKAALSGNEMHMTRNELRDFNCGIDNLVNTQSSKANKLLKSLQASL